MSNEIKLDNKELNKVSGGAVRPSKTWFRCKDCGARWGTNRPDVYNKCIECNSSNTERI